MLVEVRNVRLTSFESEDPKERSQKDHVTVEIHRLRLSCLLRVTAENRATLLL